jgi:hypothetical protein
MVRGPEGSRVDQEGERDDPVVGFVRRKQPLSLTIGRRPAI